MSDKSELEAIRTVKRYTQPCVQQQLGPEFKVAEVPLFESAKGKYVLFTDYDALLAERDAARAQILELHEKVAFLESREVCAAAHDNVETCGYCQRDAARAELKEALDLLRKNVQLGMTPLICAPTLHDDVSNFLDRVGKQPSGEG